PWPGTPVLRPAPPRWPPPAGSAETALPRPNLGSVRDMAAWRTVLDRVESARALDRVTDPLQRMVRTGLRGRLRDALHGSWLCRRLHPALVPATIGSWLGATVLDALGHKGLGHKGQGSEGLGGEERAATILVAVGTVAAVPTAAAGLNDW